MRVFQRLLPGLEPLPIHLSSTLISGDIPWWQPESASWSDFPLSQTLITHTEVAVYRNSTEDGMQPLDPGSGIISTFLWAAPGQSINGRSTLTFWSYGSSRVYGTALRGILWSGDWVILPPSHSRDWPDFLTGSNTNGRSSYTGYSRFCSLISCGSFLIRIT